MKASYSLKPARKIKVHLFRHTGEAVLFWVSVAGVLALAVIAFIRYTTSVRVDQLQALTREYDQKIEVLETEIGSLQRRVQDLERMNPAE